MHFTNVVCIADDEHSVEVLSTTVIKYSLTNKINRRTAVVLCKKICHNWHVVDCGVVSSTVLTPDMCMIIDYCINMYLKLDGENKQKICNDIQKITSQELELENQRQTNAFIGRAWK